MRKPHCIGLLVNRWMMIDVNDDTDQSREISLLFDDTLITHTALRLVYIPASDDNNFYEFQTSTSNR